ncbi:hypothetical protein DsansV1_C18g0150381 [Dioscorea sansibarensis]
MMPGVPVKTILNGANLWDFNAGKFSDMQLPEELGCYLTTS